MLNERYMESENAKIRQEVASIQNLSLEELQSLQRKKIEEYHSNKQKGLPVSMVLIYQIRLRISKLREEKRVNEKQIADSNHIQNAPPAKMENAHPENPEADLENMDVEIFPLASPAPITGSGAGWTESGQELMPERMEFLHQLMIRNDLGAVLRFQVYERKKDARSRREPSDHSAFKSYYGIVFPGGLYLDSGRYGDRAFIQSIPVLQERIPEVAAHAKETKESLMILLRDHLPGNTSKVQYGNQAGVKGVRHDGNWQERVIQEIQKMNDLGKTT